ncbi:MAG: hypothetical protein L3J89_07140 [Gammaproteobacteria bacterium]|nr:hypothetical protein [Gammaproteobacteria bacterium]
MIGIKRNKALSYTSSLIGCLLLFAISQPVLAFNFTVNNNNDIVDSTPGDGICETGPGNGICTLRAAIQESNAWPGKDSIHLPSDTYTLTLTGSDNTAIAGDLDITDDVTLRGVSQSTSIIRANNSDRLYFSRDRILDIHNVAVQIQNLTIRDGVAIGNIGGGIRNIAGALTIRNTTLDGNQTTDLGFGGGGLHNTGPLIIDNSTFINNRSSRGGGIMHFSNDMIITNSRITDNVVDLGAGSGGGIFTQTTGNATIINTTIDSNIAALGGGGGIYSVNGLSLLNSTISNNSALLVGGGGIYDIGLYPLIITNSTISGNLASGNGGGIQTRRSLATITNSTIYNNSAFGTHNPVEGTYNGHGGGLYVPRGQSITLNNTIISGNSASILVPPGNNCYSQSDDGIFSPILTISNNTIASDSSCELTGTNDQSSVNPNLNSILGINGGPTLTHSVTPPGIAIDLGTNVACPATDQRNFPRPVNGGGGLTCDIGSFEYDPTPSIADLAVILEDSMDPAINGNPLSYRIVVTNHGPDAANSVVLTNLLDSGVNYSSDDSSCNTGALPSINCSLGILLAGDSRTINITVLPTTIGLLNNIASVSATEVDPNLSNNSATEMTDTSSPTDLNINIAGSVDPAIANVPMTYTINITNNGPNTARRVIGAITLDSNIELLSATPNVGSCLSASFNSRPVCELGDLASGASITIIASVVPQLAGSVTNRVYASFNGYDPIMSNNVAEITTVVNADATLSITTIDSPDPAFQDADILYSFTVSNSGPSTTHNTQLVVTFPPGMSLSSASGASPLYCSGAEIVTCDLESITVGFKIITLVARAEFVGTYTVNSSVTSNETNTPATDIEVTQVNPLPASPPPVADLLITMVDAADPVVVGNTITYNITATNNNGPNIAQNTIVTVTLPSATQFISAPSNCSHNGGIVTCNVGTLAINISTNITISVQTSREGTFSAYATISDSVGNDPELANNTMLQTTKVNANGGGSSTGPRLNSGGGYTVIAELGVLLFITIMLFYRRKVSYNLTIADKSSHISR